MIGTVNAVTSTRTRLRVAVWLGLYALVLSSVGLMGSRAAAAILGDCNGDGEVTVDEVVLLVNIAIGERSVAACPAADPDGDGTVDISDLVHSVNSALGNPEPTPTPGPTATPTGNGPLRLVGVITTGNTSLLASFSKPVDASATDLANYSLTLQGVLTGATLTDSQTQVVLSTQPLVTGLPYTLVAGNVRDAQHNPIDSTHNAATFIAGAAINGYGELRVVGAASTSNTSVVVQFNKAMSNNALNAGNYVVVQRDNDTARLAVTAVAFSSNDHSAVTLTTLSQSESRYVLAVVNVTDTTGAPLGNKVAYSGGFVDPGTASFSGTGPSCGPKQCTNGSTGVGGSGDCASDDDCTATPPCDGGSCRGACQAPSCIPPDNDSDGLSDDVEAQGWDVTVTLTNGQKITRHVTSDAHSADTDGDGLDDKTELEIGTDPRRADTDGDGLSDYEEFNVIYSDPTNQDTDGDGNDDKLEVEFFKTNPLLADSDGDGFSDSQELYQMNRDPRIADLPQPDFAVGEIRLQLNEQFTYTDDNGQTRTEDSSTQTSLVTESDKSTTNLEDILGGFSVGVTGGLVPSACGGCAGALSIVPTLVGSFNGFFQRETQNSTTSSDASQRAFQSSLDKAQTFSTDSTVTRSVTGGRIDVAVTLQNRGDTAFTLSNMEITALVSDPSDSTKFVPVATLLPDSQQQSGNAATFNLAPYDSRGPILFSNAQVAGALMEDLMKSPRGLIFRIANYDLTTGDGRNFAFGLQTVRERTVNVSVDFGDGTVKQANAITAPVLNRPRNELRCALGGDHPDYACASDADCGTSAPCKGGEVIGGLSKYGGTGTPAGIPLEFVLRDTMHLRKTSPQVILAGANGKAESIAQGDDVQVVPYGTDGVPTYAVVIAPGRDGILDSVPGGANVRTQGWAILAGPNGVVDTIADPNDIQVAPLGEGGLSSDAIVVAGPDGGPLSTVPAGDDVLIGPDGILAGNDGIVQSVAQGDDVQLVPVGTTGIPEDTVVIAAGQNGIIDTPLLGDDVADVVTGYEVSKTCDYTTPAAIVAGYNQTADTTVEAGLCTTAFPPHFAGERGCRINADCGQDPNRPAGAFGVCSSDVQVVDPTTAGLDPNTAVVLPRNSDGTPNVGGSYVRSVPPVSSDDQYVGPGIPCTTNADCSVTVPSNSVNAAPGTYTGSCSGPSTVVRVDNRRNGQFRRFWAVLSNKTNIVQTDFSQIMVRAGDAINLSFIQDADRDGLIAQEEFLYGTSDFNRDTDGDHLDDFEEIRLGWEVGPVGQALRRVFPDPRNADSDGDGLTDLEEKDLRRVQCACDAIGPKTLLGSGNLLRGQSGAEAGGRPCTSNADCSGLSTGGVCRDTVHCSTADYIAGRGCAQCDSDPTLHRSDPRLRDTDGDRVSDFDEVFGYRTGAGIYSAPTVGFDGVAPVVVANDRKADSVACPANYCTEDSDHKALPICKVNENSSGCRRACQTDGDCQESHQCIHPVLCDDVQVVPYGTGGLDSVNTVVVAPGPYDAYRGSLVAPPASSDLLLGAFADVRHFGQEAGILRCLGGPNDGMPCMTSDDCVVHRCFGGPNDGALCDAQSPGACPSDLRCLVTQTPCETSADCSGLVSDICVLFQPAACIVQGAGGCLADFTVANAAVTGQLTSLTQPAGDDEPVVAYGQPSTDDGGTSCADGSTFNAGGFIGLAQRFVMCGIIKPGPNGIIDSKPGVASRQDTSSILNNVLVPAGAGQKIEVTDPLNPDTDGDEIADGFERILGSSPNDPTDTGLTADADQDGLSDNIERSGWTVSITGPHPSSRSVASNPYVQDTDGDGIPDYAELHMPCRNDLAQTCPTDPTTSDTDGDGLSDFDELSPAQVAQLEALNGFFAGYHFDGSKSKQYGTDPNNPDTDGDGISDGDEVLKPFYLSVPGESVVRQVSTNPLDSDTDHDGLSDKDEEQTYHTDPTDPDTDGDGRLDGQEIKVGAAPLVKDLFVTVTYTEVRLKNGSGAGQYFWNFDLQLPDGDYPGPALSQQPFNNFNNSSSLPACGAGTLQVAGDGTCGFACAFYNIADINLSAIHTTLPGTCVGGSNAKASCYSHSQCGGFCQGNPKKCVGGNAPGASCSSDADCGGYCQGTQPKTSFPLRAGQGFVLSGELGQVNHCNDTGGFSVNCDMYFTEAFDYQTVTKGFSQHTVSLSQAYGNCPVDVSFEIETD